jgi:septum formation topological specificity factor MinE
MYQEEKVSLTIAIPKNYRDRLRTMAAQQNLHDPDQLTSASTIAREIICEYIDKIDRLEEEFEKANLADTSIEKAHIELPEATKEKLERKRNE